MAFISLRWKIILLFPAGLTTFFSMSIRPVVGGFHNPGSKARTVIGLIIWTIPPLYRTLCAKYYTEDA
jgi:hypothetical protein